MQATCSYVKRKNFKSGYVVSLNQKQKFVITVSNVLSCSWKSYYLTVMSTSVNMPYYMKKMFLQKLSVESEI